MSIGVVFETVMAVAGVGFLRRQTFQPLFKQVLELCENGNEELAYDMLWSGAAYSPEEAKAAREAKEKYAKAVTTDSGLMYEVIQEGSGDKKPSIGDNVSAHYTGMFMDGRKFDSSIDRGQPIQFPVGTGRVIKGWDEALLDMKKGEKRILIIPPDLAYGKRGRGPIPPNSTLVFEVELVDF